MEIIYYSIYILLALIVSIMVVFGLGFGLHLERFLGKDIVPMIPVLIVVAIGISTILSGRNVSFYGLASLSAPNPLSGWILRLATATTVSVSIVISLAAVMRRDVSGRVGRPLFVGFIVYFTSCYVISGILGSEPSFVHNNFYALIVFFAAYVTRQQSLDRFVRSARDGLNIFIFAGLIVGIIFPQIAVQQGYAGIVPVITFRFWGLATHANNLGPVAIVFLLLLWWKPYRWWGLNLLGNVAGLSSLFLSQSKTGWIAAAAALAVLWSYTVVSAVRNGKGNKPVGLAQFALISSPFFLASSLLVVLGVGIELGHVDHLLYRLANNANILTGRDAIWAITLQEWEHNPMFGYGPRLWGDEFAYKMGYFGVVTNAHNQFVDALGSSGTLGLLCFVAYLLLILKYAWSSASNTKGFSLALAVFILARCITEAPFKTGNIMTPDFLMHFILFAVLLRATCRSAMVESQTYVWRQPSPRQTKLSP